MSAVTDTMRAQAATLREQAARARESAKEAAEKLIQEAEAVAVLYDKQATDLEAVAQKQDDFESEYEVEDIKLKRRGKALVATGTSTATKPKPKTGDKPEGVRARNKVSLRELITSITKRCKKPIQTDELTKLCIEAGWTTNSPKGPGPIVYQQALKLTNEEDGKEAVLVRLKVEGVRAVKFVHVDHYEAAA